MENSGYLTDRLGLVFFVKSISIKGPAGNNIIIQAGKNHSVLIGFDFFETVPPQCVAILHRKKKKNQQKKR